MDDFALRSKWEKWKRSLEIYFEAASITDAAKKKALLLHNGGSSLQEIYFSLPEIDADNEEDNRNVYEKMIQQLNNYFAPKQSRIYERHVFRSIQQEPNEKFDNFLLKLRRQATKCQFTNVEEHIIDQIVEKCNSEKLRRRILEMDDSKTLTDIITAAKSLETVQSQMDKYNSSKPDNTSSEINKIKENRPSGFNKVECFRCGFKGHSAKDVNCPARNKSCLQCGRIGHFKIKCKLQKGFKRNNQETNHQYSPTKKKKTTENINLLEDNSSEEYIFHLEGDDKMTCTLGGVKMDFVIDSGSKSNIISESTWRLLKEKQVKITNQEKRPDKVFRSYANPAPLLLLGSFEAKFTVANKETNAKFYVVKNGQADLLGKETAIKLGVLQIGLNILEIKEESSKTPFPKMKGISIDIPIDNNVLPVIQPLRRILVPLEEKVDKQLNKLLQSDIIEPVDGHSEWISPIVPILKSDGEVRICVDMRRANRAILRENHPLPTMNTFLPKLRKARFFSKLDVKQAFHQIEISPRSRHITTFITHKGLFRYKRLLFGKSNIADPLSRLCTNVKSAPFEKDEHVRRIVESSMPVAVSLSEIQQLSKTDEEILQVKEGLYKDVWSGSANSYKIFQHKLCFSNDILLRGNRIVIPKLLRERVLKLGHEGHPGIVCMKRRLRTKVWWPNLGQEAENLTRKCKGCTLVSAPGAPEPLKRREFPIHPWADVAIDYLGPLPEGYYILVIVDYFSRYMEVETTKTITTDKTILILRKICTRLGYPYSITADNGPQFGRSTEFKKFCEANNIKLFTTIPYWPQQNGEVERQNRSLVKRLKISKALGNDWKLDLQDYLLMYHNTPHPSTGKTPAELFFGRKLKDKLPMITDLNIEEEVRDKDSLVKQKGKEYADKRRHARDSEITEGDTVILKRMRKENKLDTTFDATPHTVISKNGGDVTAKNDVTGEEVRRNVLHMKRVGNEWKIASNDD
nr:unnamed protein product [Callosobruchus chinensis]